MEKEPSKEQMKKMRISYRKPSFNMTKNAFQMEEMKRKNSQRSERVEIDDDEMSDFSGESPGVPDEMEYV